jgi:hypothetical protein
MSTFRFFLNFDNILNNFVIFMEGSAGQNKSVGGPEMARGPAL